MQVVVAGATGLAGSAILKAFESQGQRTRQMFRTLFSWGQAVFILVIVLNQ